jgi:antitoxin PrlF
MRMTTITSKGQITIPVEFRKAVGLEEGDRLEVVLEGSTIHLRRAQSIIDRTAGVFVGSGPVLSAVELREAAEEAMAEDAQRGCGPGAVPARARSS